MAWWSWRKNKEEEKVELRTSIRLDQQAREVCDKLNSNPKDLAFLRTSIRKSLHIILPGNTDEELESRELRIDQLIVLSIQSILVEEKEMRTGNDPESLLNNEPHHTSRLIYLKLQEINHTDAAKVWAEKARLAAKALEQGSEYLAEKSAQSLDPEVSTTSRATRKNPITPRKIDPAVAAMSQAISAFNELIVESGGNIPDMLKRNMLDWYNPLKKQGSTTPDANTIIKMLLFEICRKGEGHLLDEFIRLAIETRRSSVKTAPQLADLKEAYDNAFIDYNLALQKKDSNYTPEQP